jgi:uncharacterized peroxidase-related enzyme
MSEFILHTRDTAPPASRKILQSTEKQLGFIPNLYAVMAESPATLEAYQDLTGWVDKTDFSLIERQLVLLSISRYRNCAYCLAAHGTVAKMQKIPEHIVAAIYYNQPLADPKLQALRTFTRAVLAAQGWVHQETLQTFYRAGYQQHHVLEVVLAISFKTLSNYINHIIDTPIDVQFLQGIPDDYETQSAVH